MAEQLSDEQIIARQAAEFYKTMTGWRIDKKKAASPLVSESFKETALRQFRVLVAEMQRIDEEVQGDDDRKKASAHVFNQAMNHIMASNDIAGYPGTKEDKELIALRFTGSVLRQAVQTCIKLGVPCSVNSEMFGISQAGIPFL